MEVATTNNQSHHHHHHQQHNRHQQQQTLGNGVGGNSSNSSSSILTGNGSRSPFQREVREWQRIDPDTGALLSGRLEADRWINGPLHSYGKISDSQNISQPNGTQHTQRKQFEVLKARTANGAVQVIRTQTVQKSSSRWSTTHTSSSSSTSTSTSMSTNMPVTLPMPLLTLTNANHWSQLPTIPTIKTTKAAQISNAVDICEVSDNDQHIVDDDVNFIVSDEMHNDENADAIVVGTEPATLIAADVVVGDDSNNTTVINGSNSSYHRLGHNLLLNTAPSLKLSNLMKSSSSISSNSSINSNTATAATATATTTTMNTHRNAAKVSLHAIVGHNTKAASSAKTTATTTTTTAATTTEDRTATGTAAATMPSASTASSIAAAAAATTTTATPWHKRLSEQPDLYGNSNNKQQHSQQSRVGVNASFGSSGAGDAAAAAAETCTTAAAVAVAGAAAAVRQTPTQLNRQTRRDLESFRHYNEHAKSSTSRNFADDDVDDVEVAADDDDDLRLTARHQRRQQVPQQAPIPLQRTRSISTEDLSNDWERHDLGQHSDDEEPGEWRRVSKLRRSFQSQIKANDYKPLSPSASTALTGARRPFDLPSNSVSVSRIRAELENGRRLNTAMRNNHVDLAALDTLLNTPPTHETKQTHAKRTTFLTAESLKEIRGKLKKLSDESLYKEDFLAHQTSRATPDYVEEHIEVQLVKPLAADTRSPTPTRSAFQPVRANTNANAIANAHVRTPNYGSVTQATHKTHSLESRQKYRDTSSSEWHLRRKSYGFEKMSPPEDRAIFRVDASTDSGLGRSGEQLGNWSPTETAPNGTRSTIIHFGEPLKRSNYQRHEQPTAAEHAANEATNELNKRHSIAVEESQYMRKSTQVRLNGIAGAALPHAAGLESAEAVATRTQHKRVEFCKTEVHFAAESGRVNIVETDGKPPPTNNFRRRRRSSTGPLQSLVSAASTTSASSSNNSSNVSTGSVTLPITHFGDTQRHKTIATSTVAYKATLMDANEANDAIATAATQVTVSIPKPLDGGYSLNESSLSRSSYTSTSGIDTTDNETDDISAIRGILKNKPIKPKPYHLGENIDSADALWGVQLKSYNAERGILPTPKEDSPVGTKSVAERVRIVEKRQIDTETNNYSTKINLSLGDKDWTESDLPNSNVLSIALHSPKAEQAPAQPNLRITQLTPVAKPRTTISNAQTTVTQAEVHTAATVKQQTAQETVVSNAESLKIVKEARGARKLREHELSYFGVPLPTQNGNTKPASPKLNGIQSSRRCLPSRKLSRDDVKPSTIVPQTTTTSKWQLLNDRPDLLRHSPTTVEPQLKVRQPQTTQKDDIDEDFDEHFYENIAHEIMPTFRVKSPSPNSYDRKTDVQRDVQILSEMTRNADQTLKAISDEAAIKDQRRRSTLQRRNSKPLETIDEKSFTSEKTNSPSVTRGTFASEARRNSLRSTPSPTHGRSSSQSSIECCPRARSRSLSSEREYENIKQRRSAAQKATTTITTTTNNRRSSSLESATQGSSGDDQQVRKREERMRTRTPKRVSSSSTAHSQTREKQRLSSHSVEKRPVAAREETLCKPRASSMRERKSTQQSERTHSSSHRHKCDETGTGQHAPQRTSRSHGSSSATRLRSHSTDRHEKHGSSRLVRSTRHAREHDGNSATKHRVERSDKEKEKLTRSRGHSSRSSQNERERERKAGLAATTTSSRHTTTSTQRHSEHKKSTTSATKSNSSAATKHATKISAHQQHQHQKQPQQQQQLLNDNELTYVYVTNLANTTTTTTSTMRNATNYYYSTPAQIEHEKTLTAERTLTAEPAYATLERTTNFDKDIICTMPTATPPPILPPPRRKRQRSLIPIPIAMSTPTSTPTPTPTPTLAAIATAPQSHSNPSTYEYKTKMEFIPPSYSNQSTLRKTSLKRKPLPPLYPRKASLKHTQSTHSSFAFLPYLPAKRNSDVSHVYDNYLLYATPSPEPLPAKPRPYAQNLVNEHAKIFGSQKRRGKGAPSKTRGSGGGLFGYTSRPLRMRHVRSSVSTHHPFGICTCS